MEFFANNFDLFVNVSFIIFIVSFIYRISSFEDVTDKVKPLTNLDEIFVLGNRKCKNSYFTEPKGMFPNKISGGIWDDLDGETLKSDWNTGWEHSSWDGERGEKIIDSISTQGPYHITVGETLEMRREVCEILSVTLGGIAGMEDREYIPVDPTDEALSTLSSCKCPDNIGAFFGFGKSTFHIVLFVNIDKEGYARSRFTQAFSMQDHEKAAMFAAIVARECIGRGKRVLIAGSPTIPTYNEAWITDGSVDKQFIMVSPLELASKIAQLGDRGIDAITIIQKIVNLLFV